MTDVMLIYGDFDSAVFRECRMERSAFVVSSFKRTDLDTVNLHASDLRGGQFVSARFAACDLTKCSLQGARLHWCAISRSILLGADATSASLNDSTLSRTDMRTSSLARAEARRTVFEDCDLRGANVDGLLLGHTRFVRCKLYGITGKPRFGYEDACTFEDCDLSSEGDGSKVFSGEAIDAFLRA